jgi:hypothetical protein
MSIESLGDTRPITSFSDLPAEAWSEPVVETTASPAADPAPIDTATDPSPEAATAPPAADDTREAAPSQDGPIPFDRHKAILEGERTKLAEAEAKWQRVAWADELAAAGKTPEQVREALAVFDSVQADPVGTLERLYDYLQSNPQLAPQARSWAGRVLGTKAAEPAGEAEPQPDFQDPATGAKFYSQEQQARLMAWRERQVVQRLEERFQPLITAHERALQQERERGVAQQAEAEFAAFKDRPHFAEHKADILAFMQARQWNASLSDAYAHVLETKVLPKLAEQGKAQAVADFQKQAQASSARPSAAAPVTPAAARSFMDPSLKWD